MTPTHFPGYSYGMMLPHGLPSKDLPGHSSPVSVPASELRSALAQPSRLVQQEQLLQQQQQRLPSSLRSVGGQHPSDPCPSPGVVGLGQHRMPFTLPEPRLISRAEPKTCSSSQPSSSDASGNALTGYTTSLTTTPTQSSSGGQQPHQDNHNPQQSDNSGASSEARGAGGLVYKMYEALPRGVAVDARMFSGGASAATQQMEYMLAKGMVTPFAAHQHLMAAQQAQQSHQQQQQQQQPQHMEIGMPAYARPPSAHHALPMSNQQGPLVHIEMSPSPVFRPEENLRLLLQVMQSLL